MARFDVYTVRGRSGAMMVDVQANILNNLASHVVIPLVPATPGDAEAADRLKPVLSIAGVSYTLLTTDLAARSTQSLGVAVANIEAAHRDEIVAALDFLFQGF